MYDTWYTDEPKPTYCRRCRDVLVEIKIFSGYNAYTGEEAFKLYLICPKVKDVFRYTEHDTWEIKDEITPFIRLSYL